MKPWYLNDLFDFLEFLLEFVYLPLHLLVNDFIDSEFILQHLLLLIELHLQTASLVSCGFL